MKNDPPSLFDLDPDEEEFVQGFAKKIADAKKRIATRIESGPSPFESNVKQFAQMMIKEGYRTLASKHHPDKGGSTDSMTAVNAAEQRLSAMVENW